LILIWKKMNKKKHLIKDYKKRLEYKNKEILRLKYLMIKNNNILPLNIRMLANDKLANGSHSKVFPVSGRCRLGPGGYGKITQNRLRPSGQGRTLQHSPQSPCSTALRGHSLRQSGGRGERSKIRNRCILTGRSRGIIKEWQISRIKFKLLADQGLIPGIRRASW